MLSSQLKDSCQVLIDPALVFVTISDSLSSLTVNFPNVLGGTTEQKTPVIRQRLAVYNVDAPYN